ncbi:hypothetical protein, partial [Escherichia coli]|uniref:hypothetical protein n=1 Tax=Escherichia coli TaxID=562 RepID=UPI0013D68D10
DMGQFLDLMLDPSVESRTGATPSSASGPALAFEAAELAGSFAQMTAYASLPGRGMARPDERRWTSWGTAYAGERT